MEELRFRQVHLDFHTNELIENIGSKFHPEEFAETLKNAHVNSVSLFARCHHGMMYYDSQHNPERIHPHLTQKNLLKQQIDACHRVGIRTPIYTTVQWDYYTSQRHRDWLCMDGNGQSIGEGGSAQLPFEAGFYETLCLNTPYRQFLKEHIEEILDVFTPVDGIFLDIVMPVPCACPNCRKLMKQTGYRPEIEEDRLTFYKRSLEEWQAEMTAMIQRKAPEATVFYNRGHVGIDQRRSAGSYTHFELESLPSGTWGYLHFPSTVRYARNLGKEYLAHTGKFHTMWGDFQSYKNQAALEFECFHMLAMGARCLIGDQLNPDGRLSPAVYELIGNVYRQIESKEEWCKDIVPVVEIGVFTAEEFLGAQNCILPKSLQGAVRMLQECSLQFDVIDTESKFDHYQLLILPDEIPVDKLFAERLSVYMKGGGKLIFSCKSGLQPNGCEFALDIGIDKKAEQPTDIYGEDVVGKPYERGNYGQYILPGDTVGRSLPKEYHVMYFRGLDIQVKQNTEVLVNAYASVFDREYEHFCSHRQSPCSGELMHAAVVKKENSIYFSHPIFTQYQYNAPLWCKKLMRDAILMLMEECIISHNGPSTLITSVNDQLHKKRRVVHLLHYIPERRCQEIDVIEDVIPLYEVQCKVKVNEKIKNIVCQPQNILLEFVEGEGSAEFIVPKIEGHQIIVISYK